MEIDLNWEIYTFFLDGIDRYIAIAMVKSERLEIIHEHICERTFQTESEAREYAENKCMEKAQELESRLSELDGYLGMKVFHNGEKESEAQ